MTPLQFRAIIKKIGISQRKAASLFGYHPRHGARWAIVEKKSTRKRPQKRKAPIKKATPVPYAVAICLRLLEKHQLRDPKDLLDL